MSVAQTKFKKSFYHLKSPHGIMVKNLHPKNSAPSNSKTEVSLKNIHVNTIAWSTLITGLENIHRKLLDSYRWFKCGSYFLSLRLLLSFLCTIVTKRNTFNQSEHISVIAIVELSVIGWEMRRMLEFPLNDNTTEIG